MLGNRVEQALTTLGFSQGNVEAWLGKPCGCEERKQKLNALDSWARRVVAGRTTSAEAYLRGIMGIDER